jgi:transcriptional regulator with XRE-family HTH domain
MEARSMTTEPTATEGRIIFDMANAGPALRDIRLMLGIGQRDLARRIGAVRGTDPTPISGQLWGWEAGKTNPTAPSLAEIFDALGFDLCLIPKETP